MPATPDRSSLSQPASPMAMPSSEAAESIVRSLITSELERRPRRRPDLSRENAALHSLAHLMAGDPQLLLEGLCGAAVELCGGVSPAMGMQGSAGVSLLESDPDGGERFRWVAIRGPLSNHVGGTTPREFSPCGVCLDHGAPVLFSNPDRVFTYFQATGVPFIEGLVLPFYAPHDNGRELGTIWIVSHHASVVFDAEDVRVMSSLASFTAAAFRIMADKRNAERARAEAESESRAKTDFLATVSHELRTPLNAIGGHAQLLAMGVRGMLNPQQQESVERIEQAQRHLLRLINEVLDQARVESGRVSFEVGEVCLADVVAEALPMVEPQLAAKGMTYEMKIDRSVTVSADRSKLQQIVINLLANAVKFTPDRGRVTIDTATRVGAPGVIFLRVSDTGMGIPPTDLETVFTPYMRVAPDSDVSEGAGLGLTISRDLARGMGGDLRVRSVEKRGTTFTVTLPSA